MLTCTTDNNVQHLLQFQHTASQAQAVTWYGANVNVKGLCYCAEW